MPAAAAFAVYVLVTALLFRDLLPHLATHVYSDLGDPVLNAAILYWNTHHLPLTPEWWNFPSFAPLSGVTAFTEHLLLAYPLATPVILATDNPILAHNLVLLLAFPLNGIAAYLLARHLTGSNAGAFIGGLAFAFAPYQSVQLSHIQSLAVFGMPLAMLGLHRYRDAGSGIRDPLVPGSARIPDPGSRIRRFQVRLGSRIPDPGSRIPALLLFGLGWLCTALANAYTLVFFPVLVLVWCVWFIHPSEWRRLVPVVVTAVVFSLPVVPLLWGYQVRQGAYGFVRGIGEMRDFAADINAVFGISQREQLWRWLLPHTFEESALFPGITIAALAAIALLRARGAKGTGTRGAWSTRLLVIAAALTAIVLARLWIGPFGWHLGPVPLPPFQPFRVFTIAAAIGIVSLALNQRLHAAWRRRDPIVFYAVAILVLWFMAIGPQPEWSAAHFKALTYGPYYALIQVPGFSSIRVPARAWLQAVLCLAMLAAWGAAYLADHAGPRRRLLPLLAIAIVAEGWFADKVVAAPPRMAANVIPPNAMTIDLPIDEGFWNTIPEYQAVLGGYRTINGYSGYEPKHFDPLRHRIADAQADALNPFRTLGDVYAIIHARELPERAQWILDHPGAQIVYRDSELRIVKLPAMSSPPRPPIPIPLPRHGARPFGM